MKKLLVALFALSSIVACKKSNGPHVVDPPPPPTGGAPAITPVGQPTGAVIMKSIGPSGGAITSEDGKVKLTIPAGALDANLNITMQPIQNNSPMGMKKYAFRLLPHGLQFKKPVKLSLNYDESDIIGSAPEVINVATQTEKGTWMKEGNMTVNLQDRTITAEINHFSDWAFYEKFKLIDAKTKSDSAVVNVGVTEEVGFRVLYTFDEVDGWLLPPVPAEANTRGWSINGLEFPNTNHNFGGIDFDGNGGNGGLAAIKYIAPRKAPDPNTVTLTARLWLGSKGEMHILRNIKIVDINKMQINGKLYPDAVPSAIFINNGSFLSMGMVALLNQTKHASVSVEIQENAPSLPGTYTFNASEKVRILAGNENGGNWSSQKRELNGSLTHTGTVEIVVSGTAPNRRVTAKIKGSLFPLAGTNGAGNVDCVLDVVAN